MKHQPCPSMWRCVGGWGAASQSSGLAVGPKRKQLRPLGFEQDVEITPSSFIADFEGESCSWEIMLGIVSTRKCQKSEMRWLFVTRTLVSSKMRTSPTELWVTNSQNSNHGTNNLSYEERLLISHCYYGVYVSSIPSFSIMEIEFNSMHMLRLGSPSCHQI
jgi:hypothetical protein